MMMSVDTIGVHATMCQTTILGLSSHCDCGYRKARAVIAKMEKNDDPI